MKKYNLNLVFGDQDIINIYFHYHPNQIYLLHCEHNYRPDHCMYTDQCSANSGIKIVHGSRGYFHKAENQPIFAQLYSAFQEHQLGNDPCSIIKDVEYQLEGTNSSNCNELSHKFLHIPKKIFRNCGSN